jgi:hypothetical protein
MHMALMGSMMCGSASTARYTFLAKKRKKKGN